MVEKFKNLNITSRRVLTLLRKAEKSPDDRNEHFQYIINRLPDPAAIISDGRCEHVNPAFTRVFGHTAADFNDGIQLLESLTSHPTDSGGDRSVEHDEGLRFQRFDIIDNEGTLVRSEVAISPISYLGRNGELLLFRELSAGRGDPSVYDTRRAAGAESPRIGDWHCNVSSEEIIWSREVYEMFETSPGKFRPSLDRLLDYLHTDDREKARKAFERAVTTGDGMDIDLRVRLASGERIFRVVAWIHRDDAGRTERVVGTLEDITERRSAEHQLRLLSIAVEQSAEGMAAIAMNGTVLFVNAAFARMHGYEPAEIIGRHVSMFHTPEQMPAIDKGLEEIIRTGASHGELWHVKSDGTVFPTYINNSLFRDEEGQPIGILGTMRDISEQKEAQKKLRQSEETYRNLFHNAQVGLFRVSIEQGTILECNNQMARMFGYASREELLRIFDTKKRYVDPTLRDRVIATLMAEGQVHHIDAEFLRQDGSKFWARYSARIYPEHGWIEGVMQDITERKSAEGQLRESEERFRTAFITSPDAVNLNRLDDGVFVDINDGFSATTGYTRDEVIGQSALDINVWCDTADRERLVQRLIRQGKVDNMEAQFRCKDGRVLTGLMSARLIDLDGKPHILSITRDITEWRRVEEDRQKSDALYHTLFDAANDAILILKGMNFIDCNRKAEEIYGRTRDEIIGHTPVEFSPEFQPDGTRSLDATKEKIKVALAGDPHSFEWAHSRPDGSQIHADVSLNVLRLGEEMYVMAIVRDFTERKKAEDALRFTQFSVDHSSDAAYWMEKDGRIIYVNDAACQLLEYTQDELLSMSVQDIDPHFPDTKWTEHWDNVKRQTALNIESQHRTKSGRLIPIDVAINHVEFKGREYHCAFVRDITRRKEAQQALADSERLLASILSNLPGMAYNCVNDGRWTMEFVSEGCKDLTGFGTPHLMGKKRQVYEALVHSEDRPRLQRDLDKALSERMPYTSEYRITTIHDEEKWVWEQGRGIYDDSGRPVAMEGIITDITVTKRLELELRATTKDLRDQRQALQEKNIALNQLLDHLEERKKAFHQQISADLQMELVPLFDRLKENCASVDGNRITKVIENIKIILSKNVDEYKIRFARLSPREVEISIMIARGMSTKEISEKLVLSPFTIHKHRELIRRKLELANKGINLSTYLKSHLSDQLRIF